MAAFAGRDLRIKVGSTAVAGARSDGLTVNQGMIDITDKDDAGVRTLLDEVGTWSISGSLAGVLKGTTLIDIVKDPTAAPLTTLAIELTGLGTWGGDFFVTSLETTGEDGENPATFSCNIESSGTITWTPAV